MKSLIEEVSLKGLVSQALGFAARYLVPSAERTHCIYSSMRAADMVYGSDTTSLETHARCNVKEAFKGPIMLEERDI